MNNPESLNKIDKSKIIWLLTRVAELYKAHNPQALSLEVYIVGSQSIWGKLDPPPKKLWMTKDIDVMPAHSEDDMDIVLEDLGFALGVGGVHEEEYKSALDAVDETTIHAPLNWKERTTQESFYVDHFKMTINLMDHHDLLFCKMTAGREKDYVFIEEMFRCNLLSPAKINKILRTEMDHELQTPEDYKRIENKLNYFINKHLKPRTQVSANRDPENDI